MNFKISIHLLASLFATSLIFKSSQESDYSLKHNKTGQSKDETHSKIQLQELPGGFLTFNLSASPTVIYAHLTYFAIFESPGCSTVPGIGITQYLFI